MSRCLFLLAFLVGLVVVGLMGSSRAQGDGEINIVTHAVVPDADSTQVSLVWTGGSAPYQVQSSDSLPAEWTPETGEMTMTATTVSAADSVSRRFYRVVSGEAVISHEITTPSPGMTVTAESVQGALSVERGLATFAWTADDPVPDFWWFYVGTEADPDRYHTSGRLNSGDRSQLVRFIPFDGSTVRVSLWSYTGTDGPWISKIYNYTTESLALPAITSPAQGSTIGASGIFAVDSRGVNADTWFVFVGSSVGASDHFSGGIGPSANPAIAYAGVPSDGSRVFVRLFWQIGGGWQSRDYRFRASDGPVGSS